MWKIHILLRNFTILNLNSFSLWFFDKNWKWVFYKKSSTHLLGNCRRHSVGERFDFRVQLHQVLDVWRLVAYLSWGSVSEIPFHETLFSLKITIYPERSLEHAGVTLIGHGRHLWALAVTAVQNPGQEQNILLKQVSCVECLWVMSISVCLNRYLWDVCDIDRVKGSELRLRLGGSPQ